MKVRQQGTAELRPTTGKDGSVHHTEIVEVEGPPELREQIRLLANQIAPLPPLPAATDVFVMTASLAFNYPGESLMDSLGRGRRAGG
jgi:hypothetical protein